MAFRATPSPSGPDSVLRNRKATSATPSPFRARYQLTEGDLITGAHNRSAIGTLVERCSRFTILLHLPDRHTAEAVRDAIITAFQRVPPERRRSLTWDQGSELALHAEISQASGVPVFFCEAHSPWQRPSNENTNGLLRQYFPKGSNLAVHSAEELTRVVHELNDRPRKTLGWASPAQLLAEAGPSHDAG